MSVGEGTEGPRKGSPKNDKKDILKPERVR